MVKYLPNIYKALGLIPALERKKKLYKIYLISNSIKILLTNTAQEPSFMVLPATNTLSIFQEWPEIKKAI